MGKETGITWADSTLNPWVGCQEVSPACDACYAREFDARFGGDHWGKDKSRRFFGEKHWNEPLKWNRAAAAGKVGKSGRHWLVFCASLADVFESRDDLEPWRFKLWGLIKATPALTWMLLTKRPQNIGRMLPEELRGVPNLWLGSTVESPEYLWRAEKLCEYDWAKIRFLSMEPLLAETSIANYLARQGRTGIDWCISGGESGEKPRPVNPDWMRMLRSECSDAGVPFHLKQLDEGMDGVSVNAPDMPRGEEIVSSSQPYRRRDLRLGADGMKRVKYIIERPYLDGVQSVEFPP